MEEIFSWDLRFLLPARAAIPSAMNGCFRFPASGLREGSSRPRIPEMVLYGQYGDWGVLPDSPPVHFDLNRISKEVLARMMYMRDTGRLPGRG